MQESRLRRAPKGISHAVGYIVPMAYRKSRQGFIVICRAMRGAIFLLTQKRYCAAAQ